VQEFTTRGTLPGNIQLQSATGSPWHATGTANDQFVVSCGASLHGVCLVDSHWTVIRSYGGQQSSLTYYLVGLAVDKHGNVLVADQWNCKPLVLDNSLISTHEMSVSVDGGPKFPPPEVYGMTSHVVVCTSVNGLEVE